MRQFQLFKELFSKCYKLPDAGTEGEEHVLAHVGEREEDAEECIQRRLQQCGKTEPLEA